MIGMIIVPISRFRTRPLSLEISGKRPYGHVTGFAQGGIITTEDHEDSFL